MHLKDKLRQLDRAARAPQQRKRKQVDREAVAELLGGKVQETPHGELIIVRNHVPLASRHGHIDLQRSTAIPGKTVRLLAQNRVSEQFDLTRALFLDTETTGLAGGTGTYVFLIGVGYFSATDFVVEQLFLPGLEAEIALLRHLEALLEPRRGLVTFNGKSYDVPLLVTRAIRQRLSPVVELHEHFDLLHAARRLVKNDLGDCSLGTLEQGLLGVQRHGDIPGAEIPQIYMDYLRWGRTARLPAVLYHNRVDIVSLLALAVALAQKIDHAHAHAASHTEAERVAELHLKTHSPERAAEILQRLVQEPDPSGRYDIEVLLNFARVQKRLQRFDQATAAWLQAIEQGPFVPEPFVELAKFAEHRQKDFRQALHYTERALRALETRVQFHDGRAGRELLRQLQHRRARLLRKLQRRPGLPQ